MLNRYGAGRSCQRHEGKQCQGSSTPGERSCGTASCCRLWRVCVYAAYIDSFSTDYPKPKSQLSCRFAGSKQVAEAPTTLQDVPSSSISNLSADAQAAIDSETLLHLKRLSKRDSTTKHKALQASTLNPPMHDTSLYGACELHGQH